jgi:hypothetical protein
LQAKPAYFGVVNPTLLPGFDLDFRLSSKTGPLKARVWTITANNQGPGTAYTVQIDSLTLQPLIKLKNGCVPVITPPLPFPISLGDLPEGGSASASFTINFKGCLLLDPFVVNMPWSSANGAHTGQLRVLPQLP